MYEFLLPKKENLDGNQVRLMSCGILPTSSPGVVSFLGFPGRFVTLQASLPDSSCCSESEDSEIRICEFIPATACVSLHFFYMF